jgi:multidrug efflux pump subunit AcrA (membrane-fusion protein)
LIYQKLKQVGDYVRKGDAIAVIGSAKLIYAKLNVDEANMAKLKPGQPTVIQLNTDKSKRYMATVRDILPAFDAASQSFIVRVYFKDPLNFKATGTQLEANIVIRTRKNVLVIPTNYLDYGNKVTLKETHQQVVIKPGVISDQWTEILGGLTEQDILLQNQH